MNEIEPFTKESLESWVDKVYQPSSRPKLKETYIAEGSDYRIVYEVENNERASDSQGI